MNNIKNPIGYVIGILDEKGKCVHVGTCLVRSFRGISFMVNKCIKLGLTKEPKVAVLDAFYISTEGMASMHFLQKHYRLGKWSKFNKKYKNTKGSQYVPPAPIIYTQAEIKRIFDEFEHKNYGIANQKRKFLAKFKIEHSTSDINGFGHWEITEKNLIVKFVKD